MKRRTEEIQRRGEKMMSKRLPPSKIAHDIAREMMRHMEAGMSREESKAEIERAFPTATPQDIMRACQIGHDAITQWQEENAGKMFDLLFKEGAEADAEFKAAMNAKPSVAAVFPEPDKTKS